MTDFGIARSLHVEHGVTQTGTVLGTGEYLAPEQASGKPVSPATDVYSLGVVLWELLAGDVPFTGDNFVAVALRHVNEPPPRSARAAAGRLAAARRRGRARDGQGSRAPLPLDEGVCPGAAGLSRRARGARCRRRRQDDARSRSSLLRRGRPRTRAPRGGGVAVRSRACCSRSSSPARRSRPSCCSEAGATTTGPRAAARPARPVHLTGVGDAYVNPGHPDGACRYRRARNRRIHLDLLDDADVRRPGFRRALPGGLGLVLDAGQRGEARPA